MSESGESGEKKIKTLTEMVGNYPAKELPLIFADRVPSIGWLGGAVKFYLLRNDPSISGESTNNPQLVAQVVMPIGGFAATALFFEDELNNMIASGDLKREYVNELRTFYRKRREEKDAAKN